MWLLFVSWCRRRWLLCCYGDPPPEASRSWWRMFALKRALTSLAFVPPEFLFCPQQLADCGWSVRALRSLWRFEPDRLIGIYPLAEILSHSSVQELFDSGFKCWQLRGSKPVRELLEVYGLSEISKTFSDEELGDLTPLQMQRVSMYRLLDTGETRRRVVSPTDVIAAEKAAVMQMLEAQLTVAEMRQAGAMVARLRLCNFSVEDLIKGGYTPEEIRNGGYTTDELKKGGITPEEL